MPLGPVRSGRRSRLTAPAPLRAIPALAALRRALAGAGLQPAQGLPPASDGRSDQATIQVAEVVEGDALRAISLGGPEQWPGPVSFLDGIQKWEVVAYHGASPVIVATVAAAVRKRIGRKFTTASEERRHLVIARPEALEAAGDLLDGWQTIALATDDAPHPVGDAVQARIQVEQQRAECEREAGRMFRKNDDGWLIVDGTLTDTPDFATDPKMLGVIKSHASLPFGGAELEAWLRLPAMHRTSVYAPRSRARTPVHAWAVRLWEWEGKDLLHGLVRVEAQAHSGTAAQADQLSRWLLNERAPISTPDARWDRLLYGIHDVERYLKAKG